MSQGSISVFVLCLATVGLALTGLTASCGKNMSHERKVIVIGMDGMDPRLCERMMDRGELPHLDKLRKAGGFKPLGTSVPPQSPVAWSNFITGADAGIHGVFDFIQRKPEEQCDHLYYGAADTLPSDDGWVVGEYRLPLPFWPFNHKASETKLLRDGVPFWDYLDRVGVPMWFYDIPANYPPSESKKGHLCCVSGMGTPDLMGGYGTYQFYSEEIDEFDDSEGGGHKNPLEFEQEKAEAELVGPTNSSLIKAKETKVKFTVHRHPEQESARIDIQNQTVLLKEGEWSDWVNVGFEITQPSFLPSDEAKGICRFYLQQVRPTFRLYVSPINVDPSDPYLTISEPPDFIEEIADDLGSFYTAGFQEDYKALYNKVFTDEDYRNQARYVLEERKNLLNYALNRYQGGLLFFYFSSTDLHSHMFWWDSDEKHPIRDAENAKKYHGVVEDVYREMDKVVGRVVERFGGQATLMVMSDHGFCNFKREFNLNAWLRDEGYLYVDDPKKSSNVADSSRNPVDWTESQAYSVGLNSLFINLAGRERDGIVEPEDKDALMTELTEKLMALLDPDTGKPVVAKVYRADEIYHGPHVKNAPDLIVGYHRGYRAAWSNTLGGISKKAFQDNKKAWSADHCIAAEEVPGVLFANRPIARSQPSLIDMAPTILEEFGVPVPSSMRGGSVFKPNTVAGAAEVN